MRKPYGPILCNPLIAESLFRVKYVEKAGTGSTDMIADRRKAGLPEPDFEQRGPHFVVTVQFRIADTFTDSLVKLTGQEQSGEYFFDVLMKYLLLESCRYLVLSNSNIVRLQVM